MINKIKNARFYFVQITPIISNANSTMEPKCVFVNSRGLLKSCTFHSTTPKSSCSTDSDYLKQMLLHPAKMHNGMSIYVCSDLLKWFVLHVLPRINHGFVLVSGDSDMCIPMEALSQSETNSLINNPHLLKWFAQNFVPCNNPNLIQLPIGLDYHTISDNPMHHWRMRDEGTKPVLQEKILLELREKMKPFHARIPLIYVNFTATNDRFHQRKQSIAQIPNDLLSVNPNGVKRTINWKNITQFAFVLSPFGMGMDCHRTWEALCLGAIPILKADMFGQMFAGLPVLIVNDWREITRSVLDETIQTFKSKEFNYEKITLKYWTDMINSKRI